MGIQHSTSRWEPQMSAGDIGDRDRILVVDGDPDTGRYVSAYLEATGYEVVRARTENEVMEKARTLHPSLVLLDSVPPNLDGVEVCRRLRRDRLTGDIAVIVLTDGNRDHEQHHGFDAGADDCVIKPFEPDLLHARVEATLRRAEILRGLSPLTGLPGGPLIEGEIAARVEEGSPFALLYADLDDFKAYNDHYGFSRGDDVIRTLARILADVTGEIGSSRTFLGHVGGDDFVALVDEAVHQLVAEAICRRFDRVAPLLYDHEDRRRGSIKVVDRQGLARHFPIVSVSIGIAHSRWRSFAHPSAVVEVATQLKQHVKRSHRPGSNWLSDRRIQDRRTLER